MKIGLMLPLFSQDAGKTVDFARRAEDLGYDGVFAFDHLFPPGGSADRPALEAFAILGSVGAATSGIEVGTLVARASLRPVGLLAKTAAGIDHITGGRLVLGLGAGDPVDLPEHRAYGLSSLGRRESLAHLEECVAALRCLFHGEAYPGGEQVPAIAGPLLPPPARPQGPPVWLGGSSEAMVRLAARIADGWNGWGLSVSEFAEKASLLAEEAAAAGRPAAPAPTWAGIALVGEDDVEAEELLRDRRARGAVVSGIRSGSAGAFAAFLGELEAAGAAWAVILAAGPSDRAEVIARRVLPAIAPA